MCDDERKETVFKFLRALIVGKESGLVKIAGE